MDISKGDQLRPLPGGKKKILIFSTAFLPLVGGAEIAVKEITDKLSFDWDMITSRLSRRFPKTEKIGRINVYRIGVGVPIIDKFWLAFFGHRFAQKLYDKNQYSLIWSIMASHGGFAAMFFKKKNQQVPFLLTLQEGDSPEYIRKKVGFAKKWFREIFKSADYIQCISHFLADWAKQNGAVCPVEVVPNGVDISKVKNHPAHSGVKVKNKDEKVIITTSRLVYKNGVDILIKAAADLKNIIHGINFKVLILGSGPDEKNLKHLAKELKIDGVVQFLGHIEPEKISDYLIKADVFVRPSRSEGLGNSFLEAMAVEIPVIGTPVGGIPDFLKDEKTGLFVKTEDPKDLALKIKRLIEDENLRQNLVKNGLEAVREKYDWNIIAKIMRNIFEKLLALPGGMKILIATGIYPPDIGGPATYSKLLFNELPKRGIKVDILSFGAVRRLPKVLRHFVYFFKVLKKGKDVNIIFAQDPVSVGLPSMLAAKILKKKFVLKIVGDYAWEQFQLKNKKSFINPVEFQNKKFDFITELRRKIQKFAAKRALKIIVPSEYLKNIVMKWGINDEKIEIIYNAFNAPKVQEKLNLIGFNIISAGRLVSWKGFTTLLNILPDLIKDIPDLKIIIIGYGPLYEKLLRLGTKDELKNHFLFHGRGVSHEEILRYLNSGDLFVLNTGYEGFSHQILEAMASGIPVITTNVGGNPELIENNNDGILVEYNDKEQLKNAILRLYKDNDLRGRLVKKAKEKIKKFSKEKMIEKTISALSSI